MHVRTPLFRTSLIRPRSGPADLPRLGLDGRAPGQRHPATRRRRRRRGGLHLSIRQHVRLASICRPGHLALRRIPASRRHRRTVHGHALHNRGKHLPPMGPPPREHRPRRPWRLGQRQTPCGNRVSPDRIAAELARAQSHTLTNRRSYREDAQKASPRRIGASQQRGDTITPTIPGIRRLEIVSIRARNASTFGLFTKREHFTRNFTY